MDDAFALVGGRFVPGLGDALDLGYGHAGLPPLSARRLRSAWIVRLLAEGISPVVVARAAGMASPAGLAAYHYWVPALPDEEVVRLLCGSRR